MENWIKGVDYPEWMIEESLKTLSKQHLLENETPKQMYERITETLGETLYEMYREQAKLNVSESKKLTKKAKELWYSYMWKGWLSPSTPILANCGTDRGYTISCYVMRVPDSLDGIYEKVKEMGMLTKYGGGVGITIDKIRGRGEKISKGGFTEGVVPFIKVFDSAVIATSQGGVRRGSISLNLPVRHKDINEFLNVRLPEGDVNRQCLNVNHCVTIDDYFMEDVENGNIQARDTYAKILTTRMKTGQPYIMYYHNVHNQRPEDMKKRNLKIDGTNICSEILSFHDKDHTTVCDLASLNISKYDEWVNDSDIVEYSLLFLDVNLQYFIKKAKGQIGFENAVRFAEKSRLLGLGLLGLHTYLQSKMIPFTSLISRGLINTIGNLLKSKGDLYNKKYGKLFGSPEWCDENRNLCLFAVAPTMTTAIVQGGVSNSGEPIVANAYVQKTAKGTFIRKNKQLIDLLETKYPEHNTNELWKLILEDYKGSVQKLDFLTDEEKEVFLTAYEINQLELIRQNALLQKYIDQTISLNLFFPADVNPKWFSQCHLEAWKQGIKTLYYVRTESISSRDMNSNTFSDCVYCEG
jgi:ribonucleoside-diphosphate reductase alpha chain